MLSYHFKERKDNGYVLIIFKTARNIQGGTPPQKWNLFIKIVYLFFQV